MLLPKRAKYRKWQRLRGSFKGISKGGSTLAFGSYGLKSIEISEVSSRQIEAARRVLAHHVQRAGKIWVRVFPHKPITLKAAEVPMGSGKGNVDRYTVLVKPGTMLFEMDGIEEKVAHDALLLAGHKLPVKTKFVSSKD
ncbi:50S ribosomal protein L16 [Candidatus Peregrinibacteria bacterium RIFCSPLOWO2_02_FULL_48_14]|nr:MAG: 50S ribosomal protein L16 [Candidatus Peregrinibacteria bacterium RIFCSPLOWO2_01_FULL_48_20]OGJ43591.1 MAG: 50S ribosomal protein L16 [Candidatus Peregrinibacteria bacterium RIFCSPLOWO2_02_FULL_48_14]